MHTEYDGGEQPMLGDRVEHMVDGDTGTVVEIRSARAELTLTVVWERETGPWAHFPDELRLISRAEIAEDPS